MITKPLKVGTYIRITDSVHNIGADPKDPNDYHELHKGATYLVQSKDVAMYHESDTHKGQQCLRGDCSIRWEYYSKPIILITEEL